jgi:hypothetical protein
MNARAKRIRAAADMDLGDLDDRLVNAIACMVEAATAKGKPAKDGPKLEVGVAPVFEAIKATGKVLCEPVDNRWFGRLGKLLTQVKVGPSELTLLCEWLEAGGVGWWSSPPTFEHALNNLPRWLNTATEWDRRGRPPFNSKGGMGDTTTERPINWVSE